MLTAGVLAGLLILCSAVLTTAYAAATQIGASRLRTLQEEGFSGAAQLGELRDREPTVRIGVRIVSKTLDLGTVALVTVTAGLVGGGPSAVVAAAVASVLAVLVFADVIPHAVASRSPVRMALASAPALLQLARLTKPLAAPITHLEGRLIGNGDEAVTSQQRELREIQELGEQEGILEESENLLVERAFHLDELTAWDVMVPRVDVFAWKEDLTLEDIVDGLPEVPYSRVPVYADSVDDVTGILYIREVYERVAEGDRSLKLGDLARAPFFVPGSLSLAQLLKDFQTRRIHMGIVADEFGGTDGLVTLEDVLEELVGEIHDETDVESEDIVHVSPVAVEVGAGVDVREIDDALDVSLPRAEHRSLNGFILEELGHVPDTGATFERAGVRIDILEATDTQVVRARLTKLFEDDEEG